MNWWEVPVDMNCQVGKTPLSVMSYRVGIVSKFGQTDWSYSIVFGYIYRCYTIISIKLELYTASSAVTTLASLLSKRGVDIGAEGQFRLLKKPLGFGRCKGWASVLLQDIH